MIDKPANLELTPELLQQNPLLAAAITGMSMFMIAVLIGSLASWTYLILKARRREPWLKAEPLGPRAWGLADLVVLAVLVVLCQTLLASAYVRLSGVELDQMQGAALPADVSMVASIGNLVAVGLALVWLALRYQVSPAHVGFHLRGWMRQFQIAVIGTLAALPVVYLLMAAVSIGLDAEYQHPLLDEIRSQATLGSYLLGAVTAVLVAPLAEEFLFRGMIQGWLQSWQFSSPRQIVLGESPSQRAQTALADVVPATIVESDNSVDSHVGIAVAQPPVVGAPTPLPHSLTVDQSHAMNQSPFGTSTSAELALSHSPLTGDSRVPAEAIAARLPPIWPSVATGILFGLAHWGYGLSFVPLIVLGIVLGLIYRATNSIWPCFLLHMALNGTSMLGLGLGILIERAEPVVAWLAQLL